MAANYPRRYQSSATPLASSCQNRPLSSYKPGSLSTWAPSCCWRAGSHRNTGYGTTTRSPGSTRICWTNTHQCRHRSAWACHQPIGQRGTMLGRSKDGHVPAGGPAARAAILPTGPKGKAVGPIAGAAFEPIPDNAMGTGLMTGAPAVQLCGTDKAPMADARPTPADTAPLPAPYRPGTAADGSVPAPDSTAATPAAPAAPATLALLASPAALTMGLMIDATVLACPLAVVTCPFRVSHVDRSDDTVGRDDAVGVGEASPRSTAGTADISPGSVMSPARVPTSAAGMALAAGGVNGDTVVAAAEAPA